MYDIEDIAKNSDCPKKNINLNSDGTRRKIFKFLIENTAKINDSIIPITSIDNLDQIKNNEYIVCPVLHGTRSWILFFKSNNDYYAVNFPKHHERKRDSIVIHPIDIKVSEDYYLGTIASGVYFNRQNERYIVIDEVYMLCGNSQLFKYKDDRLDNIASSLNTDTIQSQKFHIYVSQYFKISEKGLTDLFHKIKTDPNIRDIVFCPRLSNMQSYSYTIIKSDLVEEVTKLYVFKLQKTNSEDVYNVLDKKTGAKIDIAYIPDIITSKKCKQWFKGKKITELLVKCKFHTDRKKWIPVEICDE